MADLLKDIKYNKNGSPILSAEQIEDIVEKIIYKFNPILLKDLRPVPIPDLMKSLKGIKFNISPLEREYLGRINLKESLIELNAYHFSMNKEDFRWRFTLAHEIGHFFLHSMPGRIMLEDTEQMFRIFDKPHKGSIRDWEEWHANTFASALLIPRRPFQMFVERELRKHDFVRNKTVFFLDDQPESRKVFNTIIDIIHMKSNVSKAVARIRLEKFGYVKYPDDSKKTSARHISEIF